MESLSVDAKEAAPSVSVSASASGCVDVLGIIGFKAMLGWHYVVLFSPLLVGLNQADFFSFFFERQMILYISVAVSFVACALLSRFIRNMRRSSSRAIVVAMGVMAVLSSLSAMPIADFPDSARMVATFFLGASEAALMFLWLTCYLEDTKGHVVRSFAVDMIAGAALALLVCFIEAPLGQIAMLSLPVLATAALTVRWRVPASPDVCEGVIANESKEERRRTVFRVAHSLLVSFVFALAFGILQGAFLAGGIALLMASNPLVLVGMFIAGCVIFFLARNGRVRVNVDSVHRHSLLLFAVGVVGLSFVGDIQSPTSGWVLFCEIVILAGFNLFDFGGMVLGIDLREHYERAATLFVHSGRVVTYVGLACGLLLGKVMLGFVAADQLVTVLHVLCGVVLLLLVTTVLAPFYGGSILDDAAELDAQSELEARITQEVQRSVEEIVRKERIEAREAWLAASDAARDAGDARHPDGEGTPRGVEGKAQAPKGQDDSDRKRNAAKWKATCAAIAKMYKLSPRETEILQIIAKGRNAEYVHKELVISVHTAKTHISNIYHKLDVHSSQELISLIEAFREQEG